MLYPPEHCKQCFLREDSRHPNCFPSQRSKCRWTGYWMDHKETFWMACDSTEQLRAEYGPFQTRAEAEAEAHKLGFGYLLRYEHLIDANDEVQEVRCVFIELPTMIERRRGPALRLHTRRSEQHTSELQSHS